MSCENVCQFVLSIKNYISKIDKNDNYYLDIISFLCSNYLFLDDEKEKDRIINDLITGYDDDFLIKIINFIMDKNIIYAETPLVSKWTIINGYVKRDEYYIIRDKDTYKMDLCKEHEIIYYKDIK